MQAIQLNREWHECQMARGNGAIEKQSLRLAPLDPVSMAVRALMRARHARCKLDMKIFSCRFAIFARWLDHVCFRGKCDKRIMELHISISIIMGKNSRAKIGYKMRHNNFVRYRLKYTLLT